MASPYEAWLAAMVAAVGVDMILDANSAPERIPGMLLLAAASYLLKRLPDNDNDEN
jgi:hypothetical protein